MPDVFRVLDLLVSKVAERHADEVDLVAYYGSHARGTATAESDLDLFYIPAEGKNPPVGRTVLIEGLLFDFWPIPWERLEGFATGHTRGWSMAPSLVYSAKVVYQRSEAAALRLDALKQKIDDLQKPEARPHMVRRALEMFPAVLAHLGNLRLAVAGGRCADVRHAGFQVLLAAWECLALANQVRFDQGVRSVITQVDRLHTRPADFEHLVRTLGTSMEPHAIMAAAEGIALGTREVLRRSQQAMAAPHSVPEVFGGAYPELKDGFRKVLSACARQLPLEASIAAWQQQVELSQMLADLRSDLGSHASFNLYSEFGTVYAELGLPNLMECPPDDTVSLAAETTRLDQRLRRLLQEHAVNLAEFETVEAFERSL